LYNIKQTNIPQFIPRLKTGDFLRKSVKNYYFVKTIQTYSYVTINGFRKYMKHIEIFGEKENVEVAEYIYHALYNNALEAWKQFSIEQKKQGKKIRGNFSKAAFLKGLFDGYIEHLDSQKQKIIQEQPNALILLKDPLLDEMYRKQYPNTRMTYSYYGLSGGGYNNGVEKGKNMRIARAVTATSNNRVLSA